MSTRTQIAPTQSTATPLVEELCGRFHRADPAEAPLLCAFAKELFTRVPANLTAERTPDDFAAMITRTFRFADGAQPGGVNVEVLDPAAEGWPAPVTVIRVLLRDRPFVVDTLREYLAAESLPIRAFIHPILRVERANDGRIVGFGLGDGAVSEALVHVEVAPIPEPNRREAIRREIVRRLRDVVAATDDFRAMLEALDTTVAALREDATRFPSRAAELQEIGEFLRWLEAGHFVFLGYRSYRILADDDPVLKVEPGSGLGILRSEETSAWAAGVPLSRIEARLRERVTAGATLIVSKSNAESTVHRRTRMDYIGVKILDDAGNFVGERRFLGLFTSKAFAEPAEAIPILRDKLETILARSGSPPGSHDYKEIITIFNSMPKEELFQASAEELEQEVQAILSRIFVDEVLVTIRPDSLGRGVSATVMLPRGRFSAEVRGRVEKELVRLYGGEILNYFLAMSEGDRARLHYYVSTRPERIQSITASQLERAVRRIIRSWEDHLLECLVGELGRVSASRLVARLGSAFSQEYRAAVRPEEASRDLLELDRMLEAGEDSAIALFDGSGHDDANPAAAELKLYLAGERLVLSDFMPVLDHAGLRVVQVSPFELRGPGLPELMIYSFSVEHPESPAFPFDRARKLARMLRAVRAGDTPNDGFNSLVLCADLHWREVDVLRAYAHYGFQVGTLPSRPAAARALAHHPPLARLLVQLFLARFDPDGEPYGSAGTVAREQRLAEIRDAIHSRLEEVTTLAEDRALRRIAAMIEATTRTNYFRCGVDEPGRRSGGVPYLSLKIRSADMEELSRSRLLYEVFVISPRMEGIHLRASAISRGGIRWSDRPDDFRTEIFGLVQTQIVKNAVIVPGGSKGGFVTKRTFSDREAALREAEAQYRTLIRGLLDITDNRRGPEVIPPERVVRYDGDDPYLVVAADKGTAHLSDVANTVAAEYDFWLGDAFASGGSQGYDHKKEGITARGAWECVRRHFREMDKDIQAEPFTVVGVGDMSGDVFGNGMLLSRQIRLLAAFDHRHVFIDPDPNPGVSYAERARLAALPRSSWLDYDRSKLSPGAMIVPRASKEVTLTREAKAALGIPEAVERLDGEALVRAVLTAPAELLWNGGIGTYVKETEETHADVGDSANDPVRVDADQLRCKVVGEGGNLGFTQRARVAYALRGGRINTDAVDNSGGVDMSDHEVNLKILLNSAVAAGELSLEERNRVLAAITNEVSDLVLANNRSQSLAVSLDEVRSREALPDFAELITSLERQRVLERGAEGIPSSDDLRDRVRQGIGLTRPTLCVLLAYAKLTAKASVLSSPLPDDSATLKYLSGYFPGTATRAVSPERLLAHQLRREIVTTALVSDLVDVMGSAFLHRVSRDTGRSLSEAVSAWFVANELAGGAAIRSDLARIEAEFPAPVVHRWLFGLARVLERTTRWMLNNVTRTAGATEIIGEHMEGLARLRDAFPQIVAGEDRVVFGQRMQELQTLGVDRALSSRLITLRYLPELLDTARIARESGMDPVLSARAYYLIAERLDTAWLQNAVRQAMGTESWEKRFGQALLSDVNRAQRAIAHGILSRAAEDADVTVSLAEFENRRSRGVEAYRAVLGELREAEQVSLAAAAVAVRALNELGGP